ncbi:MAG: MGMT family protein [Bdellovibrionales bacterium]
MSEPNAFTLKVMKVIRQIPRGKVATYKQVAGLSGKPGASRAVAWILNSCSEKYKLPWQRVINSQGKIAFKPLTQNFIMQKKLLQREGVSFINEAEINMAKFQWKKKPRLVHKRNQPRMFS